MSAADVLDNWRSDQITNCYAQIALKLLHLPFVIILDVFFFGYCPNWLLQEEKQLLDENTENKTKLT